MPPETAKILQFPVRDRAAPSPQADVKLSESEMSLLDAAKNMLHLTLDHTRVGDKLIQDFLLGQKVIESAFTFKGTKYRTRVSFEEIRDNGPRIA